MITPLISIYNLTDLHLGITSGGHANTMAAKEYKKAVTNYPASHLGKEGGKKALQTI